MNHESHFRPFERLSRESISVQSRVQNQVPITAETLSRSEDKKSARAALTIPKESSSGVNTPSPFLSNAANSSSSACEPWAEAALTVALGKGEGLRGRTRRGSFQGETVK